MTDRFRNSGKNAPYRRGLVKQVDAGKGRVRVDFADEDTNVSMWLTVNQSATGANKSYGMPDVGSMVNCLVDWDGEDGTVLGAVWSQKDAPPTADADTVHIQTKAGTDIVLNKATGDISVSGAANLVVEAGTVTIRGAVEIEGSIRCNGHDIGDTHRHKDVSTGGDLSGEPQ